MENKRYLKRGIHFDFHTMPGIYDFGRDFDAAEFAKKLADAHVTIINMFARCNIGFAYYPTKIGTPYPHMKGDLFGDVLRECHARGIKVVAYINNGIDHTHAIEHPEWVRVAKDSKTQGVWPNGIVWRHMCSRTGYGEYVIAMVKELVGMYDVDGLFFDIMGTGPCWCPKCVAAMHEAKVDINDEDAVREFNSAFKLEYSKRLREAVPDDKLIIFNGLPYTKTADMTHHIEIECLANSHWGYEHFPAFAAYARNIKPDVLYMTGRFQTGWGDFGGFKPKASLENDIYDALCSGVQYSVGDHLHPASGLESDIYDIIGDIYSRTMAYEKYTDEAIYKADVAVMVGDNYITASHKGAARILSELKYGYDLINESMDFTRYSVIILPDDYVMTDTARIKLEEYLAGGGKLLCTGRGGLDSSRSDFALAPLRKMLTYGGADTHTHPYYISREKICEAQMPYFMYSPGIIMTAKEECDVTADYVGTYFEWHWDGLYMYRYMPYEKKTGETAAAIRGNIAYICFDVFTAYNQKMSVFHKKLVADLLGKLLPEPLIRADSMPSTSRVTLTGTDDYTLLHVKVTFPEHRGTVGTVEEHVTLPAGREVYVRGKYSAAYLLPDESPIPCEYADGYTRVTLPEIVGYDMFLLK